MKRLQIIGNLTKDCEVRNLQSGKKAINFTVAVNGKKKNASGQFEDFATYFKCVYWRDADQDTKVADYLKKGSKVYAEGDPDIDVFMSKDKNEPVGTLKMHVKYIDIAKVGGTQASNTASAASNSTSVDDDGEDVGLPF